MIMQGREEIVADNESLSAESSVKLLLLDKWHVPFRLQPPQ